MASIAIMIVVMAVCLFVHPTSGGALLVLALGGSLAALILDYRRRERERSLAAAGRFGAGELQTEVVRMRIWPGMRVLLETEV